MTAVRSHAASPLVREVPLPDGSLVSRAFAVTHYADAFALTLPAGAAPGGDALVRALASSMPWWVAALLRVRDRAVALVGLKSLGGVEREAAERTTFQPGDRAGLFNIYARTDDEILMGADDRHLNFRASMLVRADADGHAAVLSTVVRYNGRLGRFYFFFVRPFHRRIIPAMLRRVRRQLARDSLT